MGVQKGSPTLGLIGCIFAIAAAGCSTEDASTPTSPSSQATGSAPETVRRFVDAYVAGDLDVAGDLVCPDAPPGMLDREPPSGSTGFSNIHVMGRPREGESPNSAVKVEVPRTDFHVPVEATIDGRTVSGSISIQMGEQARPPCVMSFGIGVDQGSPS